MRLIFPLTSFLAAPYYHTRQEEELQKQTERRSSLPHLLTVFYNLCINYDSCSPRGWASCLLGMLEAFLSVALSAEVGLYLQRLCQGELSDRAKLVKKLIVGRTQCSWRNRVTTRCRLWSSVYIFKQPAWQICRKDTTKRHAEHLKSEKLDWITPSALLRLCKHSIITQ